MTTDKKSDTPRTDEASRAEAMLRKENNGWYIGSPVFDLACQLERELNEATYRIAELESQRENWRMSSVCRELEAKCKELEKDKARIDWLDANIYGSTGQPETEHTPHPVHTWIFEAPIFSDEDGGLRASIDAAMAQNDER